MICNVMTLCFLYTCVLSFLAHLSLYRYSFLYTVGVHCLNVYEGDWLWLSLIYSVAVISDNMNSTGKKVVADIR